MLLAIFLFSPPRLRSFPSNFFSLLRAELALACSSAELSKVNSMGILLFLLVFSRVHSSVQKR